MRKTKRILAFVLAVVVAASCFAMTVSADETTAATTNTGTFSDVSDDAIYATAVKTFNKMGIINGYPDGTFGPDKNVTRAEFTAMLMRTLNMGGMGAPTAAALPFTDVKDDDSSINWAISDINTAYAKGIINGYEDGTFRPNANVAYEEALKMIVCTLGYTDIATDGPTWYSGYLGQANKLEITEVASSLGQVETPAIRACIAQLLYDSLEVPIVEQSSITNKNILNNYLGYYKSTGVISSDGITGMDEAEVNLRDDEIQIYAKEPNGVQAINTYRTNDKELKKYLGYEIEFFYKNTNGSEIRDLVLYVLEKNQTVTISANAIDDVDSTDSRIEYYKNDDDKRTTAINLDTDNVVIFNGRLYGYDAASSRFEKSMIPEVGTVTLLDSDMDNKYDLVRIESYEVYYVSAKILTDYSIVDDVTRDGSANLKKTLVLNIDDSTVDTTIVDKNGNEVAYSSIAEGNIICVAESRPGNASKQVRKAVVLKDTVSGKISGIEEGVAVTISGKRYKFSKAAPWMRGDNLLAEPVLQDSGVYCLDINGDICAYKQNAVAENVNYGYVMGFKQSSKSKFDTEWSIRIMNQKGSEVLALLKDGVRVNGSSCTVDEVKEALAESAAIQNSDIGGAVDEYQQLIKYVTVGSGTTLQVSKIYTMKEAYAGAEIIVDKPTIYANVDATMTAQYNATSKKLAIKDGDTTVANIGVGSATIFIVPTDRKAYSDYAKVSLASAFKDNGTYNVEVFDVSKTNNAAVVVCYGDEAADTSANSMSPVNVLTQIELTSNQDDNGSAMYQIIGYASSYSKPKTSFGKDNNPVWLDVDDPTAMDWVPDKGSIFRYGTNKEGYAVIEDDGERDGESCLIYSPEASHNTFGTFLEDARGSSYLNFDEAEYAVILGSVVATDDSSISVIDKDVTGGVEDELSQTELANARNISFADFSGARILVYDDSAKELLITDVSDDYQANLKGLVGYDPSGEVKPSKIMIYSSKGKIRLVCILGRNA
ncbi:MAG: S-layer homology domain-containing protein [Clostridia bacterium]|nr:S-layer homology domain-containing protein [Clostridia bacterium]